MFNERSKARRFGLETASGQDDVCDSRSNTGVPLALQSMVTQTDKYGNAKPIAAPQYSVKTTTRKQFPMSFVRRLFSCCMHSKSYDIEDDDDMKPRSAIAARRTDSTSTLSSSSSARSSFDDLPYAYLPGWQGQNVPQRAKPMIVPELVQPAKYEGKKCLILDLDETLVHSTFTPSANADFVVPVDIDGQTHNVYVMKRPGVSEFLRKVSPHFEIVVYTASLDKYADPLLDLLDPDNLVTHRLFRENCVFHHGHFVKDLDLMNRPLSQTIIVDNSESAYVFHPANAIDCLSFIDDPNDEEMWDIAEFLISHKDVEDVRSVCCCWRQWVMGNTARMRPPSITSII